MPTPGPSSLPAPPRILFEDTHVLVVSKPAGLLSQGEISGDPNLVDWARQHVGRPYIGLVHRLDRNTSGLMVLGKRTKSASRLTEALQKGTLIREYEAWVHGSLRAPSGRTLRWRHFLLKNERTHLSRAFREPRPGTKEAVLEATPVGSASWSGAPVTRLRIRLETGRSHQIRVQAAAEGHPLLGDLKYGKSPDGFSRTALHSVFLSFPHPMTREVLTFEDPLPADLRLS
jgi:23S rRNA pseudouridine1911/1915/1917 synthase